MVKLTKEELDMKKNFLKQRQALPLNLKIEMSERRIKEFYEHFDGKVYISFSGGKDSTVLLHLVRNIYPDVVGVFLDTGLEYPEIKKFVKTIPNIITIRPEMMFNKVIEKYGYPVISKEIAKFISEYRHNPTGYTAQKFDPNSEYVKKIWVKILFSEMVPLRDSEFKISSKCCDIMKKKPAKKFEKESGLKPFIGTMAVESNLRKTEYLKHGCNSFESKRPSSTPMGFWTEDDVLQYLSDFNIPYAPIYGSIYKDDKGKYHTTGASRTGCMFCMFGVQSEKHPNRFEIMKEMHPKQYDYCINKLGCGKVLDFLGVEYGKEDKDE